jgi:cell division protein FtsQ
MPQQKSKKILIYFFLFLLIGTLNNKNFDNFYFPKIKKIELNGLDKNNNFELLKKLNYIKLDNIFSIDETKIIEIINSNELVEKYSIFKKYPSTLKINITKAEFLAYFKKENDNYFLGSNGKFIKSNETKKNIPFIFGKFSNKEFFDLKKNINKTSFEFDEIKNLFYFKSGRWDIETYSGLKIKLPKSDIEESLNSLINILNKFETEKIISIDLRQKNQIIINEK